MINFLASIILTSLLFPAGFDFLISQAIDYSYLVAPATGQNSPRRILNNSFGLETTAKSILVLDDESASVLYYKDIKEVLPIASITKLVTALVILDQNPNWDEVVGITADDQRDGGQVYLLPGESATIKDLFNLMLVGSANEAALALSRRVGLTEFRSAMNSKAAQLEMIDSYFVEPSGIDPGNVSSAFDLVKLARAAFARPEIAAALVSQNYEFNVVNNQRRVLVKSTDQLLTSFLNDDEYQIIGAKTGYLDEAGYCLVLQVKKQDGPSLTLVLLGAATVDDRWQEAKGLVDWVLNNYEFWINFEYLNIELFNQNSKLIFCVFIV